MVLVQILLPLYANDGTAFTSTHYRCVRDELTEHFGGMTAYTRAPAEGRWKDDQNDRAQRDDIVIFEVMVERVDAPWWRRYREELQKRFAQDVIVIRAQRIRML